MDYKLIRDNRKWELWEVAENYESQIMYAVVKLQWLTYYTYIYDMNDVLLFKTSESNYIFCIPRHFIDIKSNEKIIVKTSFCKGSWFFYKNVKYRFTDSYIRNYKQRWLAYIPRLFANNEIVIETEFKSFYLDCEFRFTSNNLEHVKMLFISAVLLGGNIEF